MDIFDEGCDKDPAYADHLFVRKPDMKALVDRLNQRDDELDELPPHDPSKEPYVPYVLANTPEQNYHFYVEPFCEPLGADDAWALRTADDLSRTWRAYQDDLCTLGLYDRVSVSSTVLPTSTLSLRLSALPPDLQDAIHKTGLVDADRPFLPVISINTKFDKGLVDPWDYPVDDLLATALPSLRVLPFLQHKIAPARKAIASLRTATLFFISTGMICFLHTLEPAPAARVRTRLVASINGWEELNTFRFVKHLKACLLNDLLCALDTAASAGTTDDARAGETDGFLHEWTMADEPSGDESKASSDLGAQQSNHLSIHLSGPRV
ncbi:hypothetical protein OC844_000286 [Tilletia horrida]|nr:hypothetical protein OC844_000286 [Tilletia horrida]